MDRDSQEDSPSKSQYESTFGVWTRGPIKQKQNKSNALRAI